MKAPFCYVISFIIMLGATPTNAQTNTAQRGTTSTTQTNSAAGTRNASQSARRKRSSQPANRQLLTGQNKTDANAGTTTIITSRTLGGAPMVMARDLSTLLDDGERFEKMRIIPVVARGKVQNLWDILYLKGIDAGWVQTDTFEYLKNSPNIASIKRRLAYICRMYPAEVHIVARKEIRSLKDLDGKTVSINAKGTGSSVVATILFEKLGIKANAIHEDGGRAVARMKKGEIAAHFWVLGLPARPVGRIKAEDGLHLLPIPYTRELEDIYFPSKFTHKNYPAIIPEGQEVETIAVDNVLAVFNWPESHVRHKRTARFVKAFFDRLEELKKPGFHPKWKQVNIAAEVRGWTRFKPAQDWLDEHQKRVSQQARGQEVQFRLFNSYLRSRDIAPQNIATAKEFEELFRDFVKWRSSKNSGQN